MKSIILPILILCSLEAQASSPLDEFILSANDTPSYEVEGTPSVVDSVLFLYDEDINPDDSRDQTFGMRIKLNSLSNISKYNQLKLKQRDQLKKLNEDDLNTNLYNVYHTYLKVVFLQEEIKFIKQLSNIKEDEIRVTNELRKKGKSDISAVISAKKDNGHIKAQLKLSENELEYQKSLLLNLVGEKKVKLKMIKGPSLISLSSIKKMVKKARITPYQNIELEMDQLKYEINSNNSNKILDRIDLSVKNSDYNLGSEVEQSVGARIIFNLPFAGDKSSLQSSFYKKLQADAKMRNEKLQHKTNSEYAKVKVLSLIDNYNSLLKSGHILDAKKYFNIYSKSRGVSPLVLLKLKKNLVEGKKQLLSLKANAYLSYLEFLNDRRSFAKNAKQNLLSTNFRGEI